MIEPSPKNDALYDRLMSLRPEGLSTRAWTINAGVSSAFFDSLAAGGTPRDGELPKVLAVVGMTRSAESPGGTGPRHIRARPHAGDRNGGAGQGRAGRRSPGLGEGDRPHLVQPPAVGIE